MTPAEAAALDQIRGLARAGRIVISSHAWARMSQRGVRTQDVSHALGSARGCSGQPGERWKVLGEDLDGDDLTLVVAIDDGVVVVTVF